MNNGMRQDRLRPDENHLASGAHVIQFEMEPEIAMASRRDHFC